jgi:hypothetical protein
MPHQTEVPEFWVFFIFVTVKGNNAISLSSATLDSLTKIIQPSADIAVGGSVFYNPKGPNTFNVGTDDIYISCQPTGSSEEEIDVTTTKNETTYDLSTVWTDLINNPTFQLLLGCIIFIISLMVINFAISAISSGKVTSTISKFTPKIK